MRITKEYCDRCGREVTNNKPLSQNLYKLVCRTPKYGFLHFRERSEFYEKTELVCEDCLKEFLVWWKRTKGDK